jgi:hypothetical protein
MKFRLRTLFMAALLAASVLMGIDNARMRVAVKEAQDRAKDAQRAVTLMQNVLDESSIELTTHVGLERRLVSVVHELGQHDLAGHLQRLISEEFPYTAPQASNLAAVQASETEAERLARRKERQHERDRLSLPEAPLFSDFPEATELLRPGQPHLSPSGRARLKEPPPPPEE